MGSARRRGRPGVRRLSRRSSRDSSGFLARLLACQLNRADDTVYRDGVALFGEDLGQDSRRRRRNLGVHLVSRDFEQRLVAVNLVADFGGLEAASGLELAVRGTATSYERELRHVRRDLSTVLKRLDLLSVMVSQA